MAFIDALMGTPAGPRPSGPSPITYKYFTARIVKYREPQTRRVGLVSRIKVHYDVMWSESGKDYIHEVTKEDSLFNTLNNMRGFVNGGEYPCYHVDQPIPESSNQSGPIKVRLTVWLRPPPAPPQPVGVNRRPSSTMTGPPAYFARPQTSAEIAAERATGAQTGPVQRRLSQATPPRTAPPSYRSNSRSPERPGSGSGSGSGPSGPRASVDSFRELGSRNSSPFGRS